LTYRADFITDVFYKPTPYRPVLYRIFLRACKTSRGALLRYVSFSAAYNLRAATKHCYFGTKAELEDRLHDRIDLTTPLDWKLFNQSPLHMPTKADDTAH